MYIIAEVGINHDGDSVAAQKLIKGAFDAGANVIKFQYRNLSRAYSDTIQLIKKSSMVITDSGGLIREAYFFNIKGLFMLSDPVWPELVQAGVCVSVAPQQGAIYDEFKRFSMVDVLWTIGLFGDGRAGSKIMKEIVSYINDIS